MKNKKETPTTETETSTTSEPTAEAAPVKRGRGRPRKNLTSVFTESKPKGPGRKKAVYTAVVDGKSKTFVRQYAGQDVRMEIAPDPVPDIEETLPPPDDEYASHQYPPPRKHPTFRRIWGQFIDSIVKRDNFKVGHLNNLEILCDLYVEAEELKAFIRKNGRSYLSVGRSGETWKMFPEVVQLNRVNSQIKDYTRILNLSPKVDHSSDSGKPEEGWD